MKYCVTIIRTGCVFVEAETEAEAMDIADHQLTDTISWSDDWNVTDCIEEGVVEDFETCPVCGGAIEPRDGEDDGYGELHLYWECDNCGHSGTAIIDEHDNNAFIGHKIDW